MEYSGKLYGKVGDQYFPLIETTEDVDALKKQIAELEAETKQLRLAPHRCPVCNGNGLVSNGFYMQTSGHWSTSSITHETCRSCNGTGIVWS